MIYKNQPLCQFKLERSATKMLNGDSKDDGDDDDDNNDDDNDNDDNYELRVMLIIQ